MKRHLILASASPRRRELLKMLGADFSVVVSECDENAAGLEPSALVRELALRKAKAVAEHLNDQSAVIIGSDTIVTPDGKTVLGKPADREDAVKTLLSLSGRWHSVLTGIAVIGAKSDDTDEIVSESDVVETKVKFLPLSRDECERYVNTGEPLDKAGSYGIQGIGGALVERIDGDYYSVVGLPISRLRVLLSSRFGIDLL